MYPVETIQEYIGLYEAAFDKLAEYFPDVPEQPEEAEDETDGTT